MDRLIVQIGHRHGRIGEFYKSSGDTVSIGRAFSNDIVLSDPYIAPNQIRLIRNDGGNWCIEVIDQTNPILINGSPVTDNSTTIQSGDRITIGRTHLSLFSGEHKVEKTRRILLSNWVQHSHIKPLYAILSLLLVCLMIIFTDYQQQYTTIRYDKLFYNAIIFSFVIIIWSGLWALTGRMLRHQPWFMAQLFFTSIIFALSSMTEPVSSYMEYITSSPVVGVVLLWALSYLFLFLLLKINIELSTNLTNSTYVAGIVSIAIMIFSYSVSSIQKELFSTHPEYASTLKPPFVKLFVSESHINEYITDIEKQFDEIEKSIDEATD